MLPQGSGTVTLPCLRGAAPCGTPQDSRGLPGAGISRCLWLWTSAVAGFDRVSTFRCFTENWGQWRFMSAAHTVENAVLAVPLQDPSVISDMGALASFCMWISPSLCSELVLSGKFCSYPRHGGSAPSSVALTPAHVSSEFHL